MFPSQETRLWLVYTLLGMLADVLDTVMTTLGLLPSPIPRKSALPTEPDDSLDQSLRQLMDTSSPLHPHLRPGHHSSIARITSNLVAKYSQDMEDHVLEPSETNALDLVLTHTSIPVPRVRRIVRRKRGDHLIVMDNVRGTTLEELWPSYSRWQKIKIAFTLRRYVRQLRRLECPPGAPPGPLTSQAVWRRVCVSQLFGKMQPYRGGFATYEEFAGFMDEKHKLAMDVLKVGEDEKERGEEFDDSHPLVLTHQAINPRHLLVGEDGQLYMLDFSLAGYYPAWWEFVAMRLQLEEEKGEWTKDEFWRRMVPFVCGPYFEQERWVRRTIVGLDSDGL